MASIGFRTLVVFSLKSLSSVGFLILNLALIQRFDDFGSSAVVLFITASIGALTLAKLGIDGTLLRKIAITTDGRTLSWSQFRSMAFAMLLTAIILVLWAVNLGVGGDEGRSNPWFGLVLVVPLLLATNFWSAINKALRNPSLAMLLEPGVGFLALAVLVSFSRVPDIGHVIILYTLVTAAQCLLGGIVTVRSVNMSGDSRIMDFSPENLGFWGFDVSNYAITWASNLIVLWLIGHNDVSTYSLNFRVAMAINLFLTVYNVIKAPHMARSFALEGKRELITDVRHDTNRLFAGTCIVAIALLLMVGLTGAVDLQALSKLDPVLVGLLILGYLVNVFFGPTAMLLKMAGDAAYVTAIFVAFSSMFLILASGLSLALGMYGIAVAFVVSQMGQNYTMNRRIEAVFGLAIRSFGRKASVA